MYKTNFSYKAVEDLEEGLVSFSLTPKEYKKKTFKYNLIVIYD